MPHAVRFHLHPLMLVPCQEIVFHELLRYSAYLVTDPETADYFYLPVYTYWYGSLIILIAGKGL